jgi:3-hydroxybutyrate dehydrogenase
MLPRTTVSPVASIKARIKRSAAATGTSTELVLTEKPGRTAHGAANIEKELLMRQRQQHRFLAGKTAVVTGSTSGIGLAIAETLASYGAKIVLNGFGDQHEIEALLARLYKAHRVKVRYHGADMSKPEQIEDLVRFARKEMGSVDIVVNNAGIQFTSPVDQFPRERWDAIVAINLSSAQHMTAAALPLMKELGWGRIINVASVHGLVASTNKAAYVASKFGVVGHTKVTALEAAQSGLDVTCNAICPGWVRTPLVERQIEALAKEKQISTDQAAARLLGEKQPSKRFVEAEHIGELAAFLCSPAAAQITGAAIPIDGGWTSQ